MDVQLSNLTGRTCNNIIQCMNALHMAEKTNGTFTFTYDHSVLSTFHVSFVKDTQKTRKSFKGEFYYSNECKLDNQGKRIILQRYIYPYMNIPKSVMYTNMLVCHVRSGDICTKKPHSLYVQPPLSFYKYVVDTFKYENILIVTEPDLKNPAIQGLVDLYGKRVTVRSSFLVEDIATLLHSTDLLFNSQGTFCRILAMMSKVVKTCYIPYYTTDHANNSYHDLRCLKTTKVYAFLVKNYIVPGDWTFDDNQQKMMKTHSIKDIVPL